jgi:hypothetical protein
VEKVNFAVTDFEVFCVHIFVASLPARLKGTVRPD